MISSLVRAHVRRVLLSAFALVCAISTRTEAQDSATLQQAGLLRGTVTNSDGVALSYVVVTIVDLNWQQFSNAQGKFYFTRIPVGKHRVNVRQLGYQAATVEVNVGSNGSQDIVVRLLRIVTKLATMQVLSDWVCKKPGAPTKAGDRDLLEVFEQLDQNATRLGLLMKEFPFELVTERRRVLQRDNGLDSVERVDTTRLLASQEAHYAVGGVVKKIRLEDRTEQYFLQVPTLLDFAQKDFQKNHCFVLRGVDDSNGHPLIRVDFKVAGKIRQPDVEGSVLLDTGTFRLRRTEIRLTAIPTDLPGLIAMKATTYFDDYVPGLPVISGISALSTLRAPRGRTLFSRAVEDQATLRILFLKKRPDEKPQN